jgi:hypothetical protein
MWKKTKILISARLITKHKTVVEFGKFATGYQRNIHSQESYDRNVYSYTSV